MYLMVIFLVSTSLMEIEGKGKDKLPDHQRKHRQWLKHPLYIPLGEHYIDESIQLGVHYPMKQQPGKDHKTKSRPNSFYQYGTGHSSFKQTGQENFANVPIYSTKTGEAGFEIPIYTAKTGRAGLKKISMYNIKTGQSGLKKVPLFNTKVEQVGYVPVHDTKTGQAGFKKIFMHKTKSGQAGLRKIPVYNTKTGQENYIPMDNTKTGYAGYSPMYNTKTGQAGYIPMHNTKTGYAGYSPMYNTKTGQAGYNAMYNTKTGQEGYVPLYNTKTGQAGYIPMYNTKTGYAGFSPMYNTVPKTGQTGYIPMYNTGYAGFRSAKPSFVHIPKRGIKSRQWKVPIYGSLGFNQMSMYQISGKPYSNQFPIMPAVVPFGVVPLLDTSTQGQSMYSNPLRAPFQASFPAVSQMNLRYPVGFGTGIVNEGLALPALTELPMLQARDVMAKYMGSQNTRVKSLTSSAKQKSSPSYLLSLDGVVRSIVKNGGPAVKFNAGDANVSLTKKNNVLKFIKKEKSSGFPRVVNGNTREYSTPKQG